MSSLLHSLERIKTFCYGLVSGAGLIWCTISVTSWGKGLALLLIVLSLLPLTLRLRQSQLVFRRRWNWMNGTLLLLALFIGVWLVSASPTGQPPAGSPVSQRFCGGQRFSRFAVPNIVPEIEQLNLGLHVFPLVDPMLTRERARRLSQYTVDYYLEMERDPNFHALGSHMGEAYADLAGYDQPEGHYYLYVPHSAPQGPLPAIVFLHGSAGNFKVYTWIWAQLAEELGCVIIAPSFGFGFWDRPEGVATVRRVLDDAQTVVKLDPKRIHLAGLSNGGLGVCHAAHEMPGFFRSCIFISPVMANVVNEARFLQNWSRRPMLFLTGEADERIPFDYVCKYTDTLKQGGVDIQFATYPGEDHFLFFSQRQSVMNEISKWLKTQP